MIHFYKGRYRDLDKQQLEALASELLHKHGSPSRSAAKLGYGDNLDSEDLAGQLERIGIEQCSNCYTWVQGDELHFEPDAYDPTYMVFVGCGACLQ